MRPDRGFAGLLAAAGGDALAGLAWAAGQPAAALGCHAAACLAVTALAWRGAGPAARLLAIGLPCFGPFAIAAAFAVALPRRAKAGDAAAWHAHLFPTMARDALADAIQALHRLAPDADGHAIVSFRNVLQFGSLEQQEYVIALMSRTPRPNFAPLFQEALASHQPGVRAQAAAGLSLLEARLNTTTHALRTALAGATGSDRDDAIGELARHLDTLAASGVMDGLRTRAARTEALRLWQDLAARHRQDGAIQVAFGLALAALQQHASAIATLRAAGELGPPARAALCNSLLQAGRLNELDALAAGEPGFWRQAA